jgi:hypothetical protein
MVYIGRCNKPDTPLNQKCSQLQTVAREQSDSNNISNKDVPPEATTTPPGRLISDDKLLGIKLRVTFRDHFFGDELRRTASNRDERRVNPR